MKYTFGLYPDKPDKRDYLLRRVVSPVEIRDRVNYSRIMLPVRHQGAEGVCAAMAGAAMKEWQEVSDCNLSEHLSVRWLYQQAKANDDYPGQEGTTLRDIMSTLFSYGICLEKRWPYKPHKPGQPKKGAYAEATNFKISGYAKLTTILDMEKCLNGQGPFLMGMRVGPTWDSPENGIIKDPPTRFIPRGGHAVLCVGYDRHQKEFLIRNSWGQKWGSHGYAWVSYYHVQRCFISAWSSVDITGSIYDPENQK